MTIWRDVSCFPDYQVSDLGEVRSLDRTIGNRQIRGKILIPTRDKDGFLRVKLKNKIIPIHRLVALTFLEIHSGGDQVIHIDGNKDNNNVNNLKWVPKSGKKTQQYVEEFAAKNGFKVLSQYLGNKKPVRMMCPHGLITERDWKYFEHESTKCDCEFRGRTKTRAELIAKCQEYGYEYISGTASHLTIKCKCNQIRSTKLYRITDCSNCAGNVRYTDEEVRLICLERGYHPKSTYNGVFARLDVQCSKCGGTWHTSLHQIKDGHNCFNCFGSKKKTQQDIVSELRSHGYDVLSVYTGAHDPLVIKCPSGHEWTTLWNSFRDGHRCRVCNNKQESEILNFLTENTAAAITHGSYTMIPPYQLDFYIASRKLAIEFCGVYWHSEVFKDKSYHLDKLKKCREKNINLLTIFEDEWLEKKDIVKSKILYHLKMHTRIFARQCTLRQVPQKEAKGFFDTHHLQGYAPSIVAFGLFHKDILVSCLTIGHHHRNGSKYKWVLNRFCTANGVTVVGGASKLLSATSSYRPLISWSDNRWSDGNIYRKLNFRLDGELPPDYSYMRASKRYSKQSMKLRPDEKNLQKTERELRLAAGFRRIWDCGKQRWVLD